MWRVPFALRKRVDELVGELLSSGVVRELSSPWASPVVLVRKKNGELCFCVDYRRLNAVTAKMSFHYLTSMTCWTSSRGREYSRHWMWLLVDFDGTNVMREDGFYSK